MTILNYIWKILKVPTVLKASPGENKQLCLFQQKVRSGTLKSVLPLNSTVDTKLWILSTTVFWNNLWPMGNKAQPDPFLTASLINRRGAEEMTVQLSIASHCQIAILTFLKGIIKVFFINVLMPQLQVLLLRRKKYPFNTTGKHKQN